jgi:acyl-CoA reductase-like NAD-dependent aldehyde dehydrogenase
MAGLINEVGFPPGVVNVPVGYGNTVGSAISSHMHIDNVAFTGSTLVGHKIMEAAMKSNMKNMMSTGHLTEFCAWCSHRFCCIDNEEGERIL